MAISLQLGLGAIRSFRRLSYTAWHALAEFVDNSTQSYHDHREELDAAYEVEGSSLQVNIDYSQGTLIISDNAMGMSWEELKHALTVGDPPETPAWRSRYGFGMKTAASWFGDYWTVETKRLDSPIGYRIEVDVEAIAGGEPNLPFHELTDLERSEHFTRVTIQRLNRPIRGGTIPRVKDFLKSMYHQDLQSGALSLTCFGERLQPLVDYDFALDESGQPLRRTFEFTVGNKRVHGWAGVLARGGRSKAGFSMLHAGRVVKGPPAAWRPSEIFGQIQGSNDLVNQRLVGEVVLDDFEVSHTKDDILWLGDEEQDVEVNLREACQDLIAAANRIRRPATAAPSAADVRTARARVQTVLASSATQPAWRQLEPPPEDILRAQQSTALGTSRNKTPDFTGAIDGLSVTGYLDRGLRPDQEYYVAELERGGRLVVVLNLNHPYVAGMKADVLADHLKHSVYDAIAAWRVRNESSGGAVDMLTFFKDVLLRWQPETQSDGE